ncbi:LolA-related protein [Lysobacter soyae]|nr:LolA-related protein [Lysobacter sp. CJ11]
MNLSHVTRWMTLLCSAALLAALALPTAQASTPVDAGWVLTKMARPAPMRTQFVEVRSSRYLKTPLRIYGEYSRPDNISMVRTVVAPYSEVTKLQGSTATITRGSSVRTFSLSRVPELAGMQASFGALLSGDQSALKKDFSVTSTGTREQWTLLMTPKNAALAKQIQDITLYGRGAELRCIETRGKAQGQMQRTLLASAAAAIKGQTSDSVLVATCHGQ